MRRERQRPTRLTRPDGSLSLSLSTARLKQTRPHSYIQRSANAAINPAAPLYVCVSPSASAPRARAFRAECPLLRACTHVPKQQHEGEVA